MTIASTMAIAIIMIVMISNTIIFAITISSTIKSPIAIITAQQRIDQQQTEILVTIFVITIQQHDITNQFHG